MEASPGNSAAVAPMSDDVPALIVLNGRQRGTRRLLDRPLTMIGQAPGCDIRLNVDGVSMCHCALVLGPNGLWLRDLRSERGTLVNSKAVPESQLADGDHVTIGPFRFRVFLPPRPPAAEDAAETSAVLPVLIPSPAAPGTEPRPGDADERQRLSPASDLENQARQRKQALRLEMEAELQREKDALRAEMEARLQSEREALRGDLDALLRLDREALDVRAAELDARQGVTSEAEAQLQQRWLELDQRHQKAQARLKSDRSALRIQVAAVVAQQAALCEEEARLQQQRTAFTQQEKQLSTHLEERQRALLQLQEQARLARSALQQERAAFETQAAATRQELALVRRDVEDNRHYVQAERHRIANLWRRLKQRWHRQWAQERADMRAREDEVNRQRLELERWTERLQQERAALQQGVLRYNGEVELGRRQLRAAWDQLQADRHRWQALRAKEMTDLHRRGQSLDELAADLAEAERDLNEQRRRWHEDRAVLEREVDGLETRIRNQRRKLSEVQQTMPGLHGSQADSSSAGASTALLPASTTVPVHLEPDVQQQLAMLEKMAGEVADQRLHLAEQCQRLIQVQERWTQERDEAAAELEALGQGLAQREQVLADTEARLRHSLQEAAQLRLSLEGWQSRLAAREAAWEWERQRIIEDVQAREQLAQKRLRALADLSQRWTRRRRQEIDRLQVDRKAAAKLFQECAAQRAEWLVKHAALETEKHSLAERALALEQFRHELARKTGKPAGAEKRINRLRRRWAAVSAASERTLSREREALQAASQRLEAGFQQLDEQARDLTAREADLASRHLDWERHQVEIHDELALMRQRHHTLLAQREHFEQERRQLRDEVDRMARLMMEDASQPILIEGKAA